MIIVMGIRTSLLKNSSERGDSMETITIEGVVSIPDTMTHEEWLDMFIAFLEQNGCEFGGVTEGVTA